MAVQRDKVIASAEKLVAKGKIEPAIKEFVRYVLSREGQEAVASDGAYIPLSAQSAQRQLQRLD